MADIEERRIPAELVSKVGFIDFNTSISRAKEELKSTPAMVVTKNGEYYGLIDSRAIHSARTLRVPSSEKIGKLAVRAPRVSDTSSVEDLAYYFYKLRLKNLPYVQGDRITGVVERRTLLKMLLSLRALDEVRISEALSSPVLAIDSDASLAQALSTMSGNKVNRLVVLDNGRFSGLITKRDIHASYMSGGDRLPEMKSRSHKASDALVDGVMERNVHTIEPSATLADAARMMVEEGVFSLVVTRGRNPIGMVTVSDILENVVARRKVEQKRVFLTGFDEYTYQYEESVREELKSFMHHLEQMHKLSTEYLAMRVKRVKLKSYEMQARVSLGKNGTVRAHSEGESFHDAFKELMRRLRKQTTREKEEMLSERKSRKGVRDED
ncbi:MAG: CBS domain-containing protein [Candidatus Micrarchaeota archaeon]|nr:CBS domain-containing protein [Candidatus Micrarchaeota archaeon]